MVQQQLRSYHQSGSLGTEEDNACPWLFKIHAGHVHAVQAHLQAAPSAVLPPAAAAQQARMGASLVCEPPGAMQEHDGPLRRTGRLHIAEHDTVLQRSLVGVSAV